MRPAGLVPFEFAVYARWSWALQPAWYNASKAVKTAHALLEPVKAAVWSLLGFLFPLHTGVPGALGVPSWPAAAHMRCCIRLAWD